MTQVSPGLTPYPSSLLWCTQVLRKNAILLPSTVVPSHRSLQNNTILPFYCGTHRSPRLTPYPASFVVPKGLPKLAPYLSFAVVSTGLPCRFFMLHSTHKAFMQHAHNLPPHCSLIQSALVWLDNLTCQTTLLVSACFCK